jgi:hypothetical protein
VLYVTVPLALVKSLQLVPFPPKLGAPEFVTPELKSPDKFVFPELNPVPEFELSGPVLFVFPIVLLPPGETGVLFGGVGLVSELPGAVIGGRLLVIGGWLLVMGG